MLNKIEQYPIISIIIIVLLMLCINIDVIDVTIMEARNFITAREMINDGNWLLTTMNGEPRYQKPPLPSWLAALSGLLFGIKNIVALRLPGILMVGVTGIASYLLSLKLVNNKVHALINALITITSFYIIGIVIEAPWDIFTHGFMLVAILHLFQLFEKNSNYWKHTLIAGLFFGFSILSKGPISLYALLLPFLLAYGCSYQFKNFKTKAFSVLSFIIIALLIGGWWYLYVRLEDPVTFTEITSKETGNWGSYNVRPFYYYWSFFIQSGLWTIPAFIALLYPYMKSRVSNLKAYRFSFFWTIFAVILLSIIPEKKSRYLMPVLIPMAINTGFYIEYLIRTFKNIKDKKETIPVYFNFGLITCIGMLFPLVGFVSNSFLTKSILPWFLLASVCLLTIGVLMLISLRKKQIKQVFYLSIAFMVAALVLILPLSKVQNQADYNSISNLKSELDKKNISIYSLSGVAPEMIWQYGAKIPKVSNDSTYNFPPEPKFAILSKPLEDDQLEYLQKDYKIEAKETYDLNRKAEGERGHKKRLISQLYVFTKK
ncbi:ArnT family glycosyltransferase [Pontimicrobium aquaticum]|uniref:Glycosyltransferase n=1 Tax=Pontimicrobium aquaticum TaxID=2565367 RepID=A0A4U0EMZ4_9FLAO|nr:glycosyltransferase family 39 protein [Pontimicrobium aquaticum]TJY32870.1 glycosyltransferase [Pontimicrobium aquaticum]